MKPVYVYFILSFIVVGFTTLVKFTNKKAKDYIKVNSEMKIDSTNIIGNERYGALRGAVFFKKGYFIDSFAKMIENDCQIKWKTNGPIIDFNNEQHIYTLNDLGLPYSIFKKANNDTLNVIKDGCSLKFLMP